MSWLASLLIAATVFTAIGLAALLFRRERCPSCGRRGLRLVNGFRATIVVDGRRRPDFWLLYDCPECGASFKFHRSQWEQVAKGSGQETSN
jgi:hypothetical protein